MNKERFFMTEHLAKNYGITALIFLYFAVIDLFKLLILEMKMESSNIFL